MTQHTPAAPEMHAALGDLLAWAEHMGGWEAPCWERARALLAAADAHAATSPSPRPLRILVDFTGGLFHGAYSTQPVDIMAIDIDDGDNPRARVPGFGDHLKRPIWAAIETAEIEPSTVNAAFDGISWTADNEPEA